MSHQKETPPGDGASGVAVQSIDKTIVGPTSAVTIVDTFDVGYARDSKLVILKTAKFGMIGIPPDIAEQVAFGILANVKKIKNT
jgi:hypothetical protein